MAHTSFQRDVCRILATRRRSGGESYVAGVLALNELRCQPRRSRDVDLFHDTEAALAANKVLALVGRLKPRDWIDVISCDENLQPLGYLAWAACGKDPGFSSHALLAEAQRSSRYTQIELQSLDFEGPVPDAATLSRRWHTALQSAEHICSLLPTHAVGKCVLTSGGELSRHTPADLHDASILSSLRVHAGSIGGAWPHLVGQY